MPNNRIKITIGKKYGRLTPTCEVEKSTRGHVQYMCICDCGDTKIITAARLGSGHTQSCGCLHRESVASINYKGGIAKLEEYSIYTHMKQRCYNHNHRRFKDYGGRGIKIAESWLGESGFTNFLRDMGPRPPGFTIERKNNERGYSKSNCHWVPRVKQSFNKRTSVRITYKGKTRTATEWAELLGVRAQTILARAKMGFPVERVLSLKHLRSPNTKLAPFSSRVGLYRRGEYQEKNSGHRS